MFCKKETIEEIKLVQWCCQLPNLGAKNIYVPEGFERKQVLETRRKCAKWKYQEEMDKKDISGECKKWKQ